MSLSRQHFEAACKAYLNKYSSESLDDELLRRFPAGWSWHEHESVPGLGHLMRSVSYLDKQHSQQDDSDWEDITETQSVVEAVDASAKANFPPDALTCRQYVVYSPTYQVPALYFTMHHSTGVPLSLQEIVASPLFRCEALPASSLQTSFALDIRDSAFALLSQGDHPTLGTPSWYLHPCHTADVVEELMKEIDCAETNRPLRWLESWIMMLGNIVNFG